MRTTLAHRRRFVYALFLSGLALCLGCSTLVLLPEAYDLDKVALVSLHARRDISIHNSGMSVALFNESLGEEVIEMTLGDTEAALQDLFGSGSVVLAGQAMQSKKYDLVPEALPMQDWSQVNKMLPVDVDDPRTPPALGVLAQDLNVDAALVIRHEWWLESERLDMGGRTWAYDRCTVLLVNDEGVVVWRQTVVGRSPSGNLLSSSFQMSMNDAARADEVRMLARETARYSWTQLKTTYTQRAVTIPPKKINAHPAPPSSITVLETTVPGSTRRLTTSIEATDQGNTRPETTTERP